MSLKSNNTVGRSTILDILRILAMGLVLIWHWKLGSNTPPYQQFKDFSIEPLNVFNNLWLLKDISKIGYLGVDLFFVISGVVIYQKINSRSSFEFAIARFNRLYPAYLVIIIPSALLYLYQSDQPISLASALASLVFADGYAKVSGTLVIAAGWSLIVEISFYLSIFIIIVTKELLKPFINLNFDYLITFWALLLFWNEEFLFSYLPISGPYVKYFVAGMLISIIYKFKFKVFKFIFFLVGIILISDALYDRNYNLAMNNLTILTISFILGFFIYLSSIEKKKLNKISYLQTLSLATYPFYLLHQQLGLFICAILRQYLNITLSYLFGFIITLFLSIFITLKLEPIVKKIFNSNRVL
jgi:peptidoglycan/LPS O-acetylase OafA/YrhL